MGDDSWTIWDEIAWARRRLFEIGGGMDPHTAIAVAESLERHARPDEKVTWRSALGIPIKHVLEDCHWVFISTRERGGFERVRIKNVHDALGWLAARGEWDTYLENLAEAPRRAPL